ncbi:MAG: DUF4845 domain-containing protein [Proteobacteria bacterium]|jgi:hypothetical protein|nr:DUF4845 domain-containing protein [Pseudomonadota bacterium]
MNKQKLSSINKQKGISLWAMLFTISVIVFAAFVFMNLLPVYSNHSSVKNAVNDGLDKSNLRAVTAFGLLRNMRPQMLMDDVDDVADWGKSITVKRDKKLVTVNLNYQRVVPLFDNISLLVHFDDSVERSVD